MSQLKLYHCDVCGEQLTDNYARSIIVDETENQYWYCGPECMFTHFITCYMLMPNRVNHMRKLLSRMGVSVKVKK